MPGRSIYKKKLSLLWKLLRTSMMTSCDFVNQASRFDQFHSSITGSIAAGRKSMMEKYCLTRTSESIQIDEVERQTRHKKVNRQPGWSFIFLIASLDARYAWKSCRFLNYHSTKPKLFSLPAKIRTIHPRD